MLLGLVAGGLAACGSSSSGDAAAYCKKSIAIDTYPDPPIDFRTATPAEITAATKTYAGKIRPLAVQAQTAASDKIRDDVDVLVAAITKVASTGDFQSFESDPEVKAADKKVHQYELDTCDIAKAPVKGVEYAFQSIEKTYAPGVTSFDFSNGGKEEHELILFKKNAGVTESAEALLQLPEDQVQTKVTNVGGVDPIAPGRGDYDVVRLTAGNYVAVCFLPVGNKPKDFENPAGDGGEQSAPPHFTKGMVREFTVK